MIEHKILGESALHPDIARTLTGIAALTQAAGQLEEARNIYERALYMLEVALGPQHREVANVLHNLSLLLRAQVQYGRLII